jgi:hypothetical protein
MESLHSIPEEPDITKQGGTIQELPVAYSIECLEDRGSKL